jgi:pheromone shutdown protein TraB
MKSKLIKCALLITLFFSLPIAVTLGAQNPNDNSLSVLQAFDQQQSQHESNPSGISSHQKQVVMFLMGVPLLILLLATAAIGIAMGIYGKPWFLAHIILACLTVSLALAHVVVGLVWFYPF